MIILDVNILLYAYNSGCPEFSKISTWLEKAINSDEVVGLPWITILGFLRLSTSPHIYPMPFSSNEALDIIEGLLSYPHVLVFEGNLEFSNTFKHLCIKARVSNKLFTDAYLADLALTNHAELASCDMDFARFQSQGLKWKNPLVAD